MPFESVVVKSIRARFIGTAPLKYSFDPLGASARSSSMVSGVPFVQEFDNRSSRCICNRGVSEMQKVERSNFLVEPERKLDFYWKGPR